MILTKNKLFQLHNIMHLCVWLCVILERGTSERIAKLDIEASELAWKFSTSWVPSKKFNINLMLPTKTKFKIKDIVELVKNMVMSTDGIPYLIFSSNNSNPEKDNKIELCLNQIQKG